MQPRRPAFTAAVFDMDGLLLDSERPIRDAWLQAAAEIGVPLDEAGYLSIVGLNHRASAVRLLELFGGDAAQLDAAGRRTEVLLARFAERPFDLKPGARRLLQGLGAAGIPCAVASSTQRAELQRRLDRAGVIHHFAALCGGDEVARGKPEPDLYLLAMRRLGAAPATGVAFEDSGHGVRAALAAGMAVVAVPDLKGPEPTWQARCLAVLPSLENVCERGLEWFGVDGLCAPILD